ncbi:MAG: glycosyltransferase family 4 protein [Beijerinckiaceae bacterium]|nr:glycosyltransferase family 4 protein [Beijerinckiaceae bacterium]
MQAADFAGLIPERPPVGIIIEKADWAIRWYGTFTADAANILRPGTAWVHTNPARITRGIIEFGSQYQWVDWNSFISPRCRTVSTFFHGKPDDGDAVARHIDRFMSTIPRLDKVICSASIVRDRLINWGVPQSKLALIPIGCETERFVPPTPDQRNTIRAQLGFPEDAIVVGSFQKDGEGWGDGNSPKLIKGPDVFLATIDRLRRNHNIFVLLTGPARGYVKNGLDRIGVPFVHRYAADRDELAKLYHALDLYLITSREEGGPMGLMESMASYVPVVSTRVGMAQDLIVNGLSGFVVNDPDPDLLAAQASKILILTDKGATVKANARVAVKCTDWAVVGQRQLDEVWRPLLSELI